MNLSAHATNRFNTTHLVLNVMERVARQAGLDIDDDDVADRLYWICCDLESFPEDEGFGSSDSYSYLQAARREFGLGPKAGDACPECPKHGRNYPIVLEAATTRSGEPFVRCPNCSREWGA